MEQSRLRLQEFEERQRRIKQEPIEANEAGLPPPFPFSMSYIYAPFINFAFPAWIFTIFFI